MAGNNHLKKVGAEDEYTPELIEELRRCKFDPIYFINNYVKVQHPTRGTVPFHLYEYQERMIRAMQENRYTCILSARQQGKTATSAMYLLWKGMFHKDQTLLIASKNQSHALEIAARIRFAYEALPSWIKCGVKYYNRHRIEFENGSRIICEATTEKTGRGLAISIIYLDELAFINPRIQEELWASLAPTLSTGGSAIISSTPNGDTELYARLWRDAMSNGENAIGMNGYFACRVRWDEHPERGDAYYQEMKALLGELVTRQEVDGEFLSSDALLINSMRLNQLRPSLPVFEDMGFRFWCKPTDIGGAGKTYLVGVDPATGNGSDYSVIQVVEFPAMVQIAEWRSDQINIPLLYAKIKWVLELLSQQLPGRGRSDVIWSFERNGIGEAVSALHFNDEKQPEYAELYSDSAKQYGVFTSGKSKINSCLQLKTLVERPNAFTIRSDMLIHELKNFVARGDSYDHKIGATGDCVSAMLVITRLLKRLAEYDEIAFKRVNEYVTADSSEAMFDPNMDPDGDDEPFPCLF